MQTLCILQTLFFKKLTSQEPLCSPYHFPLSNFTYSLTLFSKFFSSFPHGTCLLSVSTLYLALGNYYLPLQVAISSNSTLRTCVVWQQTTKAHTGLLPSKVGHRSPLSLGCCRLRRTKRNSVRARHYITTRYKLTPYQFSSWAAPSSLAVTTGIVVTFFSSP